MKKVAFATKKEALIKARKLRKLFPQGWRTEVWENLGWHIAFHHGKLVHVYYHPKQNEFSCLMGSEHGGHPLMTAYGICSKHPFEVIQAQYKKGISSVAELISILRLCRMAVSGFERAKKK